MALSNSETLGFWTFCLTFICLAPQIPEFPFLPVAVPGGIHLSSCLQPRMPFIHLSTSGMPFMCLPVKIPWGHSSVNLTIYLHNIPGYFSPVCLDTCQRVSQLSNYTVYIPKCHFFGPGSSLSGTVFLSGSVKIQFLSLGFVDPNPNHGHSRDVNCRQAKPKYYHLISGDYWVATWQEVLLARCHFKAIVWHFGKLTSSLFCWVRWEDWCLYISGSVQRSR